MSEKPKTYEHDGKDWELTHRRGDIAYMRRKVGDNMEETHAVNLWVESQRRYPNEELLVAAHMLPDEADDPTLDGIIKDDGK